MKSGTGLFSPHRSPRRFWMFVLPLPILCAFLVARAAQPTAKPIPRAAPVATTAPNLSPAAAPSTAPTSAASKTAPATTTSAPSAVRTSVLTSARTALPVDQAMVSRLQRDAQTLARFPSRVPGTPGNAQAALYVESRFKEIGLQNVRREPFNVTVPLTQGGAAQLQIGDQILRVLPIYPNQIVPSTTPREGLSGSLIYGAAGRPADFNGKKVQDSIVALDFNSGQNWITAADLGARAVIFLEPASTLRGQAERKFSNLNIELPRFYAPRPAAQAILAAVGNGASGAQSPVTATLKSKVEWQRVKAENIVGLIPGKDASLAKKPGNTVVLNAYYDSMSVVPDLAPGAEAAGNCAALLEVARYFKANPAPQSIMVVANGAHHVALAGVRNFIAEHFIDKTGKAEQAKKDEIASYRAFFGLDLTGRSGTVGLFGKSAFYNQMGQGSENILLNQLADFTKAINRYSAEEVKRRGQAAGIANLKEEVLYVDAITGREGRTWRSYLPSLVALDSEAATMAQVPGLSFATANDARTLQDTPFDTIDRVNFGNLAQQINTITGLLGKSMADLKSLPEATNFSQNFGYAIGRAIYRDVKKGTSFLPDTPIPDSVVPKIAAGVTAVGYVLDRNGFSKNFSGVRGAFVERATISKKTLADPPVAHFVFVGPRVGDAKGGGTPDLEIEAYSVNDAGHVFYAPDQGSERGRFSPMFKKANTTLNVKDKAAGSYNVDASVICFECRGTTLFDTLDQRYFTVLREMTVLDAQTDANPVEYGFLRPASASGEAEIEPASIIYSKPGARFKLIMAAGLLGKRLVLLQTQPKDGDAATQPVPEGVGFLVPDVDDKSNSVVRVSYQVARDLWTLDQQRISLLKRFGINNERVDTLHQAAGGFSTAAIALPATAPANEFTLGQGESRLEGRIKSIDEARNSLVLESVSAPHQLTTVMFDPKTLHMRGNQRTTMKVQDIRIGGYAAAVVKSNGPNVMARQLAIDNSAIQAAQSALANYEYDLFYKEARRAFGLESRTYPDVEGTAQDVLKGIIFYLALLLPFSYFLERLLIGAPDIRKQIFGASFAFLAIFIGIRFVHPAFELALTPFIILLAFIILALTVVVTSFLSGKFEAEIKRLKQGVHFADVGRLSAIGAALGLGIANMRRRPMRTALTCVTLILLTFTVLSFTSVTASISNFARPYGNSVPSYQGLMVRQPDWGAMQESAVNSMRNEFGQTFNAVAPRAWYLSRNQGEPLQLRVNNLQDPTKFFYAPALCGFTPNELAVKSPIPQTLISGRWFREGDRDVCILPRAMLLPQQSSKSDAAKTADAAAATTDATVPEDTGPPLGLTPETAVGQSIQVAGQQMEIIGVFDDEKFYAARDLDDEQFTPVDYQSETNKAASQATSLSGAKGEEAQVQRYQHMDANALLLIPYDTALMLGATTRSVASGFTSPKRGQQELQDLMNRAALGVFGTDLDENGKLVSKLFSSVESTSYEGFTALLIPILIAALIIANTMLGSVFERTREIGIYSSVGLAPIHVAALFIAEAMVYAVLGSISGYLIAQLVAKVITSADLLPGITLNYSSSSAVLSTLIVMFTVLASAIYPAMQASRMSQPDIERRWRMSEPMGDVWRFQFPFTVSGQQPLGVAQFLADFFETHTDTSVGKFYTDRVYFSALPLREAVDILNSGIDGQIDGETAYHRNASNTTGANGASANGAATNGAANGAANGEAATPATAVNTLGSQTIGLLPVGVDQVAVDNKGTATAVAQETGMPSAPLNLANIAADENTEVYRLAMRVWLAPFDMGVSQDTDILLVPSEEPGLYELQLKLVRQSGEIAAWKRVNRGFMSDLRKQLLLWRTIKREGQQEYVLRGRAHVSGEFVPSEEPGTVVH